MPLPAAAAASSGRSYWAMVWYQLLRDPVALLISFILLLIVSAAVFDPLACAC